MKERFIYYVEQFGDEGYEATGGDVAFLDKTDAEIYAATRRFVERTVFGKSVDILVNKVPVLDHQTWYELVFQASAWRQDDGSVSQDITPVVRWEHHEREGRETPNVQTYPDGCETPDTIVAQADTETDARLLLQEAVQKHWGIDPRQDAEDETALEHMKAVMAQLLTLADSLGLTDGLR